MISKANTSPSPDSLLDELQSTLAHGTVARRVETLRRVTDLFINGAVDYSDEQIGLFDDVFQCLIDHIETSAKMLLANRLAPIDTAPPIEKPMSSEVRAPFTTRARGRPGRPVGPPPGQLLACALTSSDYERTLATTPAVGDDRYRLLPHQLQPGPAHRQLLGQLLATHDLRLVALDAPSGRLCPDFGTAGIVNIEPAGAVGAGRNERGAVGVPLDVEDEKLLADRNRQLPAVIS